MAFCSSCNVEIEGNPNFCVSCGTKLNGTGVVSVTGTFRKAIIFYAALLVGTVLIELPLYFIDPESIYLVLPAGFMVTGVILTVHVSRYSSRDFSFFAAFIIGILTLGCTLMFLDAATVILPCGFTLMALTLTYYNSRDSARDWWVFAVLAAVILVTGVAAVLSSFLGSSSTLLGSFLVFMIAVLAMVDL